MDSFDLQILDRLQTDSRIAHDELGDQIGLSASAVQRRIRKLKESGVIQAEQAVLDPSKFAGYLTVIVDIMLAAGGETILNTFSAQLQQHQAVQQVYYVAGEVDFIVVLLVRNMEEFDTLSRQLFMSSMVKKFSSKIVIKTQKASLHLPLMP